MHSSSTKSPRRKRKNLFVCNGIRTAATHKPGWSEPSVNFLPAADVPAIQGNSRSLALPPIRKCICGIHRIRGKMEFSVWTVCGGFFYCIYTCCVDKPQVWNIQTCNNIFLNMRLYNVQRLNEWTLDRLDCTRYIAVKKAAFHDTIDIRMKIIDRRGERT